MIPSSFWKKALHQLHDRQQFNRCHFCSPFQKPLHLLASVLLVFQPLGYLEGGGKIGCTQNYVCMKVHNFAHFNSTVNMKDLDVNKQSITELQFLTVEFACVLNSYEASLYV